MGENGQTKTALASTGTNFFEMDYLFCIQIVGLPTMYQTNANRV